MVKRGIESYYPEIAAEVARDQLRRDGELPYGGRHEVKEFERRLRARDILAPTKRPEDD